jgi:hypothetical protein
MLDRRPTPVIVPVPTVLAVGCKPEVLARAAAVLAPTGVQLKPSNLLDLRTDSAQWRPVLLLVDAELYEVDPEAFDMVALDVAAKLGVVANAIEAEVTIARLFAELRGEAEAEAEVGAKEPPAPAPTPEKVPEERTNRWSFTDLGIEAGTERPSSF